MLVRLEGSVVGFTGATRYYLSPELEEKPAGDGARRLAALMCLYAHRLDVRGRGHEYSDEDAHAFALQVLGGMQARDGADSGG